MSEEASTFECPSCGASLQNPGGAASMRCGYCGTTVVVPEAMRTVAQPKMKVSGPTAVNVGQFLGKAMEMGAILSLARKGNKADAIQLYQENTGMSAEQAEKVIEAMISGNMPQSLTANETTRPPRARRRSAGCSGIIVLIFLVVGAYYFLQFSTGPVHDFLTHLVAQLNLTKFLP